MLGQAPAGTDGGEEPHWSIDPLVKDQIVKEIVSLAADRPLVLALDDADLVDPQSLSCLAYLLRRIRSARVMAVISLQSEGESALRALYAELLRLPNAHSVRLRHLSQRGVEQLMAAGLGRTTARLLAEDCAEATGGNPLLVRSLIEDYQPTADAAPRLTFGEGFTQAVLRCLYRHDPAVMQVAHAVAILGKSASPQTLARFLGVDEHAVTRAAGALGKTGLLLDYAFRHPAVRHVVLHHVGTDDLAQLHRRGAYLLNDEGADFRRVAEQLLAADWADEDWAVAALTKAAAAAPDAPTAVRYLRTAARAAGTGNRARSDHRAAGRRGVAAGPCQGSAIPAGDPGGAARGRDRRGRRRRGGAAAAVARHGARRRGRAEAARHARGAGRGSRDQAGRAAGVALLPVAPRRAADQDGDRPRARARSTPAGRISPGCGRWPA